MNATKFCGNCRTPMQFLKREQIQLGKTGWLLGDLPNLLAGAQDLEFWICPNCRKLDFYVPASEELNFGENDGGMAQTTCPKCGTLHDLDDPKCPCCGAANPKW